MENENQITWKDVIFVIILILLFTLTNLEHVGKYIGH